MSDAIKLEIEQAWDKFCEGFDLHSNEWLDKGAGEMFEAGYLVALRAQAVPEVGFGNIAQPAAQFKKLSDDEVLWIAQSHGIDVYACNPLAFYADLISTSRMDHLLDRQRKDRDEALSVLQAQPERAPLSDEQIRCLADSCSPNTETGSLNYGMFARAIEAAHGIKQGDQHEKDQ